MGNGQHASWKLRQPGVGSSTGDFGRWMKGALEVGKPSLSLSLALSVTGTRKEGSLAGDPGG
jgi:hypothetical protein